MDKIITLLNFKTVSYTVKNGRMENIMKNIGFIYSSDQRFEELINANELSKQKEYLIRIHTCIHTFTTIMPFVNKILSYLPKAKIIGSSTSGVIYKGEILTECCLVSITEFEYATIQTFASTLIDDFGEDLSGNAVADSLTKNIISEETKFLFAFAARSFIKIDEFVERMNITNPKIHIIGGVANTPSIPLMDMNVLESFAFTENDVYQNSLVFASITSKKLSVYSDVVYVTEPVGDLYTITQADGNIIRTVDGIDTVKWYQDLLGIDFNEMPESFSTTLLFPLVKADKSNVPWAISYSPQNEKETIFPNEPNPVMYVPNEAKAGDLIRISYSSVQKTIEVCEMVCDNINKHPSEVLFGYSCVSRQDIFSNCAKWELLPFQKTNLCGALVAGEFGNFDNANHYCCFSFTIASLAENNGRVKLDVDILNNHADELINTKENIIDFLINHTGSENGISKNLEIEKTLFIDNETGLGNLTKYMFDYNLKKIDKLCMITIKNEGLLKAFMSESKFLLYFNKYSKTIINFIDNKHYSYYIYKETSIILTVDSEITDDIFTAKMNQLQNHLLEFKFFSYVPVSEFSVVMHEENMIKKAELALVRMRNKKACFLTYTTELGLEQFNAQKMKMIMILNNAISNNLVIPYFQGIRDNSSGTIDMYEALMRIEDADGNIYTPYHFMDIAREYGYYADISSIMINKVLHIFRNKKENVTINMNISDVYDYNIVHSILRFLKSAPRPENFIFELTETEEINDYQVILEFAEKVHEAGGKIAIDDFGSGFSNIVHVFKIPSDYIKIDGEIIKNITNDVYALEFLEMISGWSKKHSKEIIAEFVENIGIQGIVEQNGIRFSQGYLYSKPSRLFMI